MSRLTTQPTDDAEMVLKLLPSGEIAMAGAPVRDMAGAPVRDTGYLYGAH